MTEYLVIYEQADDGGWGAHSPDIEGVFAREALAGHIAAMRAEGLPIPEPRTDAGRIAA